MGEATVGFAGMGSMGHGLAFNLQKHLKSNGQALLITNRTKDKPEVNKLLEAGATWVDSPAELGSKCDIVFCSMAADSALESVFSSYLSGKPKQGSLFIDCSTVFPDLTSKLAGEAKKAGISYLSCPVFGRPDAALAGKTLVVASGEAAAKKKALPYLEAMGRGVLDVGDSPQLGSVMKLVGNFYIMSMMELIGEGLTLADKTGLNREAVVKFLKESFQGPITGGYAERTAKDQFKITDEEPGFSAIGGLKDATHVQNLAKQSGCSMPVVDIVVDNLTQVKERSDAGALDWASIALITREKAGVKDSQNLLHKA